MYSRATNFAISCAAGLAAAALMQMPSTANAQACVQRPNIMFCGSSSRTGANLYSGAGPFTEVSSCAPDANTQALLVTRSGSIGGNGAAWLAYLNAGGTIITEYSIAAAVYNQIYATAYTNGGGFGSCSDNAMPEVKLNPSNAFWVANNIPVTSPGNIGCGFDLTNLVTGEPTVTALGGATGGQISFALKPQSTGRLFLLEADWQDNEASFTADSRTFMGALMSGCGVAQQSVATPVPVNGMWMTWGLAALLALAGIGFARRRRS